MNVSQFSFLSSNLGNKKTKIKEKKREKMKCSK